MKTGIRTVIPGLMVALMASAADTIAYHGQLTKADGGTFANPLPLTMTFALYDASTAGTLLWGRTMPVKVETDGTFFVELADNAGSALTGCASSQLTEALEGKSVVYVGLTPFGSTEMKPRTEMRAQPRALVARTAQTVETVKAGSFKGDNVVLEHGTLGDVTASAVAATSAIRMQPSGDLTLKAGSSLKLTGTVSGYKTATDAVDGNRTAKGCGSILWYKPSGTRSDQWGSIVYPRGATLRKDGAESRSHYFGKEL